jgi:pyruvate,orthophosphate dikinase
VVTVGGKQITIKEGDWVSLDGATGEVYQGQAQTKDPDPNSPIFARFMKMADLYRGKFGVRANADIPRDAKAARAFGAEGIGLCRTEHMFFAEDRLPHVQAMILCETEKDRRKALAKLLPMQRKDFAGLFEAMDGFPVVIRTLDPPLHEFVPKREELMVDNARLPYIDLKAKKELVARYKNFGAEVKNLKTLIPDLLKRVESLHEFNPMLGHRGCRLGITYPEITEMQARAIFEAVVQVAKKGKIVIPEVMIPLVGGVEELENQKAIVKRVADEVLAKAGMSDQKYLVGTMIEIPRAALLADQVAREAEFFSFGYQRSHADHDGSLARRLYEVLEGLRREENLQGRSLRRARSGRRGPADRVGSEARARGASRSRNRNLRRAWWRAELVMFCYRVGMDYVSCSPYRVPIARLAAAQAAIEAEGKADATTTA